MACSKCKKTPCGCSKKGGGLSPSDQATLADMQDTISSITNAIGAFMCGHPIMMIENSDDINQFDVSTGEGIGCWEGWAICDGKQHVNSQNKKFLSTPNLTDRFIVAAGGTYNVDDIGGLDSVQLTAAQNGQHSHAITDPGHTHGVTDPGHDHPIIDLGHTHGATSPPHTHTLTINPDGSHTHMDPDINSSFTEGALSNQGFIWDANTQPLAPGNAAGVHTHTGVANSASVAISVANSFTGVQVDENITGISINNATTGISIVNSGNGDPHENRPPYFALLFVMKL